MKKLDEEVLGKQTVTKQSNNKTIEAAYKLAKDMLLKANQREEALADVLQNIMDESTEQNIVRMAADALARHVVMKG